MGRKNTILQMSKDFYLREYQSLYRCEISNGLQ
jgi:hypothetical protein